MTDDKDETKIERDPKTGRVTKMTMPADLPVEQRVTQLIPFLDGLQGAIDKLNETTAKHSRTLNKLTRVLIILTVCLVVLGIAHLVAYLRRPV